MSSVSAIPTRGGQMPGASLVAGGWARADVSGERAQPSGDNDSVVPSYELSRFQLLALSLITIASPPVRLPRDGR